MKPLVSVIIPVYNSAKTIINCIESVVNQTFNNWHLLIINDGSTDDTDKLVEEYLLKKKDVAARTTYIKQNNAGVSTARNEGLRCAKGDFIAFLDSDDFWLNTKLEEQLKVIKERPQVDLLATNRNNEHYDSFLGSPFKQLVPISSKRLMLKNFLLTPTVLFKKEILNEVGYFNENMKHAEDLEYFIRISASYNCFLLNKSLVITGEGKPSFGHSGLSAALWNMEYGELKSIRMARKKNIINFPEYILISGFSLLKYLRRILTVAFRN